MTFREFTGKNVEEAIRSAMKEFSSDLSELDIEILSQGSRGILGVGGEEARILAAPKSAVAAAETVRVSEPDAPSSAPAPDEGAPVAGPAGDGEAEDQIAELALAEENRRRGGSGGRSGRSGVRSAGRGDGGGRGDSGGRGARPEGGARPYGTRAGRERRPPREPRPDRPERSDRPAREPAPFIPAKPFEELSEQERTALTEGKAVLIELLRLMDVPAEVEIGMGTETSKLNVTGSDLGVLIGRRGEKLASLQHLVNLIVAKREGEWHRIAVDVENYRGRREEQLRDVADRAAKRVIQTGKIIQLEPMPALERRIIHLALVENPRVRTQSVGVDPGRRIVILPATKVD